MPVVGVLVVGAPVVGTPVPDFRALFLGLVAWVAAYVGLGGSPWWLLLAALGLARSAAAWRQGREQITTIGWLLAASAVFASALLQSAAVGQTPLRGLASAGATVRVVAEVRTDPVRSPGRFADSVYFDATVVDLVARGRHYRLHTPVLVVLAGDAPVLRRGARIAVTGTVHPSDRQERAAVLTASGTVERLTGPGLLDRASGRLRDAVRDASSGQPPGPRALVPALVDGEDGAMTDQVVEDFRTTGLTHLMAVSGTNLTLIVGALVLLARWAGVRARGLIAIGGFGVAGFILLAGPEPSVLRAAAMGTVALLGLGANSRQRGLRALGVGILVLLLLDPWLARSAGFALSAIATAGILLLGPLWRDALARWLPRWVAETIAVPLAAQIACTPVVAAISGQVSLIAVVANIAAGPFVAPATVLGLAGGLAALIWVPLGQVVAAPAGWCAAAIIGVAQHAAALPLPAVSWSTGMLAQVLLVALCVAAALRMHLLLARRAASVAVTGVLLFAVLVPLPTPGWPPSGWVLVACSVGQGDGLVLNAGGRSAVVVDAGPDPRSMDRCLRRLRVRAVPIVVLTHFHADHVDGLSGVLHGRRVGEILTSPVADPAGGVAAVQRLATRDGIDVRAVGTGESTTLGPLQWQVLAPLRTTYPDTDSLPNDASAVLLVDTRGIRILLTGDEERPSQADLRHEYPDLRADVLKVAHHGSSKQDAELIAGLGARLAVISVGVDNDYGHPAGATLDLLALNGIQVRRTDQDGDVAVVVDAQGRLRTVTRQVRP